MPYIVFVLCSRQKSLSVLKQNVGFQGWNSLMLVRIANREDPDQTASLEAVWSRSARFVNLLDWQLVFKMLYLLPNIKQTMSA